MARAVRPINVFTRTHPHCCGAVDVEGMNSSDWTPMRFTYALIKARIGSFRLKEGPGFFNLVVAEWRPPTTNVPKDYKNSLPRMKALQEYIHKHNLGTLTIGEECRNGNYVGDSHMLLPAIFVPNKKACVEWYDKKTPRKYTKWRL